MIRKRPAHPGIDVGLDLILWIAFGLLAGFTLTFSIEDLQYGTDAYYSDYSTSDSGYYTTAANGSTVYISPSNSNECPRFDSCAQQQQIESDINTRAAAETAAGVFMALNL